MMMSKKHEKCLSPVKTHRGNKNRVQKEKLFMEMEDLPTMRVIHLKMHVS